MSYRAPRVHAILRTDAGRGDPLAQPVDVLTQVLREGVTEYCALSNAMVIFAEHPEQWNLLAQRPELAAQTVEEVMRWFPSTTIAYRCATEDFDYRGLRIEKGTFFTICVHTAQRGPARFQKWRVVRHHGYRYGASTPVRCGTAPLPGRRARPRRTLRGVTRARRPVGATVHCRPDQLATADRYLRPERASAAFGHRQR